jgi:hypothetical protein
VMNSSLIRPVDSGNSSGPPAVRKRGSRKWAGLVMGSQLMRSHRLVPSYRVLGTTLTAHSQMKYRAHLLCYFRPH